MKLGSLCSGAGGLDMAVESVFGAETVWHCETDPAASRVLAHQWPGVPNYGDLTNVDWESDHHRIEPIDLLCAGWPCQPFSLAGKRKGTHDHRAIWPHIADAVRILRPRIIALENVTAVLGPEFQRVANSLAALGYDLWWTCLRASDVGAPHRRERLFVLAHAKGYGWDEGWTESARLIRGSDAAVSGTGPVNLLPTPCAQQSGNTPENHLSKKPGRRVVTDLAILVENGLLETGGELLPTPKAHDGVFGTPRTSGRPIEKSTHLQTIVSLLPTPAASDASGGGCHPDSRTGHMLQITDVVLAPEKWGKYAPAIHRWESLTRLAPAPTEPNRNGKPRLNPAFSEWMMGWPEGWVTAVEGISRNDQLRIIGNGVVPQCAAAAFNQLLQLEAVA